MFHSIKGISLPGREMVFASGILNKSLGSRDRGELALPQDLADRFLDFYFAAYAAADGADNQTWQAMLSWLYDCKRSNYFVGATSVGRAGLRPFKPYGLRSGTADLGFILMGDCYMALTIVGATRLPILMPVDSLIPMYGPGMYTLATESGRR